MDALYCTREAKLSHTAGFTGRRRENLSDGLAHVFRKGLVADRTAGKTDDGETTREIVLKRQVVECGHQFAVRQVAAGAEDYHGAGFGCVIQAQPLAQGARRRRGQGHCGMYLRRILKRGGGGYPPPRIGLNLGFFLLLEVTAKLESHGGEHLVGELGVATRLEALEQRRGNTGVGTPSSMAARQVQRPSPESETRPPNLSSVGLENSADAVRSSSHEPMTVPGATSR